MQFFIDALSLEFLQRAIFTALLASAACGVLGGYIVARRNSYMLGAVSHSLLGGIGLSLYGQQVLHIAFLTPFLGSVLAALVVSSAITFLTMRKKAREDTVLSAIWTAGVAIGLCAVAAIPGYAVDLNAYLFGNILMVSKAELWMMVGLDALILSLTWLYHCRFLAYCFNEEGLGLRGVSTFRTAWLLNVLTGLAIVLLAQTVGIVMVLALMVLPSASAARIAHTLPQIMLLGAVFCVIACLAGMAISYTPEWPAGAIIILVACLIYLATTLAAALQEAARRKDKPAL